MVVPAASVAAIMFSPVVLTSCGDDNDDESIVPPGSSYVSVTAVYDVDLSDDYFKFYDVAVVFTDDEGRTMTGPVTGSGKFSYTIPVSKLPEKIVFALDAKAKSPIPAVDDDVAYTFANNSSMTVSGKKQDGTAGSFYSLSTTMFSVVIPGYNVTRYLTEAEPEELIGPVECSTADFTK